MYAEIERWVTGDVELHAKFDLNIHIGTNSSWPVPQLCRPALPGILQPW